jgi:hypothetical protein
MNFWGPMTNIKSTAWICDSAGYAMEKFRPNFCYLYLPHLDYDLQRFGPDEAHASVRQSLIDIDSVAGDLADVARASGRSVVVLSEYGITPVDRPVHINRALRDAGLLIVREEDGGELLDKQRVSLGPLVDQRSKSCRKLICRKSNRKELSNGFFVEIFQRQFFALLPGQQVPLDGFERMTADNDVHRTIGSNQHQLCGMRNAARRADWHGDFKRVQRKWCGDRIACQAA